MSLRIETLKALQEMGIPAERIFEAAQLIQADYAKQSARSKAAERQARYRARQRDLNEAACDDGITEDVTERNDSDVTSDVTGDVTRDAEVTEIVTEASRRDVTRDLSPHTPLSEINYIISYASTREERLACQRLYSARSKELWKFCTDRLGETANLTHGEMHKVTPLIQVLSPLLGEPVDFSMDLLPALDAAADTKRRKGGLISTWSYVVTIALANRDARLKANPEPEKIHERAGQGQSGARAGNASGDRFARPGNQSRSGSLAAGLALLQSRAEAPDDVPERPEDWRVAGVA